MAVSIYSRAWGSRLIALENMNIFQYLRTNLHVFGDHSADIFGIERQSRFDRESGASVAADLAADQAALQRVDAFEFHAAAEPHQEEKHGARIQSHRLGAAQNGHHMVVGVIGVPGQPVDVLPLRFRHQGMAGGDMQQIVFVHVRVHRNPAEQQFLVVFGARQRRQAEELEDVERQLALDDLDVANDGFRRVGGKAEDIAGIGEAAHLLPGEQHLAIVADPVLLLLGADQAFRIDVLKADEDALDAGARRLLDEIRNLVAERIDLDDELELQFLHLAQMDQPVEDRLPVLVARQIVVGDEEVLDALGGIGADQGFDVVGRPVARLAALDIDDRAEGALERAAAPGVETGDKTDRAADARGRQQRQRRLFDARQVVHEIVERLQCAARGVLQHDIEPALRPRRRIMRRRAAALP